MGSSCFPSIAIIFLHMLERSLVSTFLNFRDFVNDHDESGAKVCNLQLVLVERKVTGGPLVLVNLTNFADKEACDAWFTADVFDFHLSRGDHHHPGLLKKLYICGDHGPDPSHLEGSQMATKNRPRQPKAGQSMRNASFKSNSRAIEFEADLHVDLTVSCSYYFSPHARKIFGKNFHGFYVMSSFSSISG